VNVINVNNFYLKLIFILYILLIYSCRQIPEYEEFVNENTSDISPENLALVNVNVTGVAWENSLISASSDEQGASVLTKSDNDLISSELSPETRINKIDGYTL